MHQNGSRQPQSRHETKITLPSHKPEYLLCGMMGNAGDICRQNEWASTPATYTRVRGRRRGFARGLRVRGEDGNAGQELVENLQASRYTSVRRQRLANVVLVQRQENGNVRLKRGMEHNHPQDSSRRRK